MRSSPGGWRGAIQGSAHPTYGLVASWAPIGASFQPLELDLSSVFTFYSGMENGTAQAGGVNTITLRAGASAQSDYYKDQVVYIMAGTGAGQTNRV